jgi:serine/threonine-protein kinase
MAAWNPRANAIFADLLELAPAQRSAYLEQSCGADGELRQQVEALLAAHAAAGDFLDQPAAGARDMLTTAPDSGPPLPAGGSVVQALSAASRVQLRDPEGEPPTPVTQVGSDNVPRGLDPAGRLQVLGEIARGGMGAVLKGRDTGLGRDLAVKVLLETHQGKTELVQRFVEEAQIAGQLQHPGVVPVYELGQFPDQRPYFTMKLVKGKTLAALLAARKDPAEDRPRLVGIFAQVCQTLAYAHARGVIHRDLKPSNVMVGNFGEVQVMDWGLAKVLREGGVADERKALAQQAVSVIRTQRDVGSHTQAGSVLGTPGYMAPEQARADAGLVDERADVFGLGAILCQILTGQPPFPGPNAEAMRKAQTAQLDDAFGRLDGCGADAELIALARRCLAAEPWDRPRDAGAVAAAVTAYQESVAERLRQAELAHAAEAARAEEARATAAAERKARRRTRALAASVCALLAVAAAGGLWVQRQRAERAAEAARQREAVETALGNAQELQRQARWSEARAVLEQTRDRLGETGPEDLRRRVERAAADVALVDRLDGIRLRRSTVVEGGFDYRGAERDYAATFREAGLGVEGDDAEAVAARLRDSAVGEQLVAAVDDWAVVTHDPQRRAWLLEVARRADPDAWRDRFRDPVAWRDRAGLEALARELLADEQQLARQKPQLLYALGVALLRVQGDAVPLLAAAQARHPDDFWLNLDLANALWRAKKWDEAIGFSRAAVAVRPSAAAPHNNLGIALADKGQADEAIREYCKAVEINPRLVQGHTNLGTALANKGQLDEAIREHRTAIELDPKAAKAHDSLGNALNAKGQLDEAIREHRTAIELDARDAKPHNNLGNALRRKGQPDDAIREYNTAIELDPKFAMPHTGLGNALHDKGQLDEAIREHYKAIELDPKGAWPHYNLGNALRDKGQLDEAMREFRTAIRLQPDSAEAHCNLGHCLCDQGQFAAALMELRKGHELGSRQPKWPYPSDQWVRQCERLLQVDGRLPAILAGTDTPADDAERLALAQLCQQPFKKRYAAAARFYADAFAHDAKLADDLQQQHRYNAACAAALAGCGQGEDARELPDKAALGLRRQALDWLRADLAVYAKLAGRDDPAAKQTVRQRLEHWRQDADQAGLRDPEAVDKLPAGEREACQQLWADVAALLQSAQGKPK